MPSGAKKRKAAKKKQASNPNFPPPPSSTTHSQSGDDELKHQDGRDSDGEEQENRSFVSKGKSNQGESTGKADDEEGIVQVDWELKPEEDYESGDIATGSKKKSHDGSSSGSSSSSSGSSSSDDESHVVEKNIVVVEDARAQVDLVEPLDSFPEKVTQVVHDLVKPIPLSEGVHEVNGSSLVGEADNLVVETPSVEKVSLLEQAVHVIESISIENSSSSHVAESFLKENGVKNLPSLDLSTGLSSVLNDLGSKPEDEEKAATSLGSVQVSSTDAKVLVVKEPEVNTSNGGGYVEASESPQSSDSQPLVSSAPRIVQTTSWKSCCGIFDLFTGSNR